MPLYCLIMGNHKKARFLNQGLTRLSKPEQEYIGKKFFLNNPGLVFKIICSVIGDSDYWMRLITN